MAIRTGMVGLVAYLRQFGNVGTSEVWDGVTYWTDEQLQDILDTHHDIQIVELNQVNSDGTKYKLSRNLSIETDTFVLLDINSTELDDVVTYTELQGVFTFDTAPTYERIFVECDTYNVTMALADLWERKAQHRQHYVDTKAGAQQMKLKQEYEHCLQMSQIYRQRTVKSWARKGKKVRGYVLR